MLLLKRRQKTCTKRHKKGKKCRQSNETNQWKHLAAFYSSRMFSKESCVIKKKNEILNESYNSHANSFRHKLEHF